MTQQVLGKILFGSLTASTFGLGCWQTARYFEKKPDVEDDDLKAIVRPKRLDYDRSVLLGPRKVKDGGKRGYYVYAPQEGDNLLVCVGWSSEDPQAIRARLKRVEKVSGDVELRGFVTLGEPGNRFSPPNPTDGKPFMWAERAGMLKAAGLDPERSELVDVFQAIVPGFEKKNKPEAYLTKWMHAGYAATWFSLSIAGVFLTRKLFRSPPKPRPVVLKPVGKA